MTKGEYLSYRQQGALNLVYEYYKEKFNANKHTPFLSPQEFATFLPMVMDVNRVFEKVVRHYDGVFNVVELRDREGKIIKML